MSGIGLIIVDPGHFPEMYPNVAARAHVYAALGPDLLDYLSRIARFNSRAERSTGWEVEIHASSDFLDRLSSERPGNVAIFSGRNRSEIDRVRAAVESGINVLADKPLIIRREDLPVLEGALRAADERQLSLHDMMGGQHEITANLTACCGKIPRYLVIRYREPPPSPVRR